MTIWTSATESSMTPERSRAASAAVLSASWPSDVAFRVRSPPLASRLSAIAESRVSRPSIAFAIPPTASAAAPRGVAPRMLTARNRP